MPWGEKSQPTLGPGKNLYFDRTVSQQFSRDRVPLGADTILPIIRTGTGTMNVDRRACCWQFDSARVSMIVKVLPGHRGANESCFSTVAFSDFIPCQLDQSLTAGSD